MSSERPPRQDLSNRGGTAERRSRAKRCLTMARRRSMAAALMLGIVLLGVLQWRNRLMYAAVSGPSTPAQLTRALVQERQLVRGARQLLVSASNQTVVLRVATVGWFYKKQYDGEAKLIDVHLLRAQLPHVRFEYERNASAAHVVMGSVFGDRSTTEAQLAAERARGAVTLFYSPENVFQHAMLAYRDHLCGVVHLCVGYPRHRVTAPNYLHFPMWSTHLPLPTAGAHRKFPLEWGDPLTRPWPRPDEWLARPTGVLFIGRHARHPRHIIVPALIDAIKEDPRLGPLFSPSKAFNNAPWPIDPVTGKEVPNRDVVRSARFYVCPENSLGIGNDTGDGYMTEKLVNAFSGGTVPIYFGDVYAQPMLFNPARMIVYNVTQLASRAEKQAAARAVVHQVRTLTFNADARAAFFAEPILLPGARQRFKALQDAFVDAVRTALEDTGHIPRMTQPRVAG